MIFIKLNDSKIKVQSLYWIEIWKIWLKLLQKELIFVSLVILLHQYLELFALDLIATCGFSLLELFATRF